MTTAEEEPWILTRSGIKFASLRPDPDRVRVTDIAWALSMRCRYGGHCDRFYSVAEHSVLVFESVRRQAPDDRDLNLAALFHDAHEAYSPFGDVYSPFKPHFPMIREVEDGLDRAIAAKMRFDPNLFHDPVVRETDHRILFDERSALLPTAGNDWAIDSSGLDPLGVKIEFWSPLDAFDTFMAAYWDIIGGTMADAVSLAETYAIQKRW